MQEVVSGPKSCGKGCKDPGPSCDQAPVTSSNGPSVGIVSAGSCRIRCHRRRLRQSGPFQALSGRLVRVITKSGGLSNEIIWICSQFADGITTAIGIGGDTYREPTMSAISTCFENDPQTKAVVVSEMGGNLEERAAEVVAGRNGVEVDRCRLRFLPGKFAEGHEVRPCRSEGRTEGEGFSPVPSPMP